MKTYTVYLITQISTGRKYVGVTSRGSKKRWQGHICGGGGYGLLRAAINAFGVQDFDLSELRLTQCEEKAHMLEQNYIRDFNCIDPHGFNTQSGGQIGYRISDRQREILRLAHVGRVHSPEEIERRAAKLRGKKRDPEMVERSAAKRRGLKRTAEFREGCRERARKAFTPEKRAAMGARIRELWTDPAYRERMQIAALRAFENPERRAQAALSAAKGRAIRWGKPWPPEGSA